MGPYSTASNNNKNNKPSQQQQQSPLLGSLEHRRPLRAAAAMMEPIPESVSTSSGSSTTTQQSLSKNQPTLHYNSTTPLSLMQDCSSSFPRQDTTTTTSVTRTRLPFTSSAPGRRPTIFGLDRDAVQFATRMAVLLTFSCLFVLVRVNSQKYPQGMWVLISVLFVSWFPTLDAASVMEKILQRLIGTIVGCALGLTCGGVSLYIPAHHHQAAFLALCMLVVTFAIVCWAGQTTVGRLKVIRRYSYATILCLLTFCICMLPFGEQEVMQPKWKLSYYRVLNVMVGCLVGALGSMVVWPRSTIAVLHDKTARQVRWAGEASEAVLLTAAAAFSSSSCSCSSSSNDNQTTTTTTAQPPATLVERLLEQRAQFLYGSDMPTPDLALEKYEDALADWKVCKALFPLLPYDPFHFGSSNKSPEEKEYHSEIAKTLARALRIQTTVVVLDGMIRNRAAASAFEFDDDDDWRLLLQVFADTGRLIRTMLTLPLQTDVSQAAAQELFEKMQVIRQSIRRVARNLLLDDASNTTTSTTAAAATTTTTSMNDTAEESDDDAEQAFPKGIVDFQKRLIHRSVHISSRMDDDGGKGIPKYATENMADNALLFLQLVEHLILRALRLYHAWRQVEWLEKYNK